MQNRRVLMGFMEILAVQTVDRSIGDARVANSKMVKR